ncbi:MAG: hypothetical protein HY547_07270 [Elusimicrobia bacterium]|nr:hypothetical protein [Elusimicrobiota bacterium]
MPQLKRVEPQQKKEEKKQGALAGLLMSLAKLLPGGVTNALGGPMVAGGLVAAMGVVGVGAPLALLGLKAAGWKSPAASKRGDAFNSMFGNVKGMTDSVMGEDAMRAAAVDDEEEHPDEETSLGLVIPEEVPGADKEKDKKGGDDSDRAYKSKPRVASYDGKKDSEMMEKMKGRFGSEGGLGGLGGGGSSGGMMSAGSGGKIGASNSSLSSAGGASGNAQNAGIKKMGTRIGSSRSSSAVGRLRGAVSTAGKGYSTEQTAAGYQGAAFGEMPKSASIVGGGPGASVAGSVGSDSGITNDDLPSNVGASGSVTPDAIGEEATESSGMSDFAVAALIAGAVIAASMAAAKFIGKIANPYMRWAVAGVLMAGIAVAMGNVWFKADTSNTAELIAGLGLSAAAALAIGMLIGAGVVTDKEQVAMDAVKEAKEMAKLKSEVAASDNPAAEIQELYDAGEISASQAATLAGQTLGADEAKSLASSIQSQSANTGLTGEDLSSLPEAEDSSAAARATTQCSDASAARTASDSSASEAAAKAEKVQAADLRDYEMKNGQLVSKSNGESLMDGKFDQGKFIASDGTQYNVEEFSRSDGQQGWHLKPMESSSPASASASAPAPTSVPDEGPAISGASPSGKPSGQDAVGKDIEAALADESDPKFDKAMNDFNAREAQATQDREFMASLDADPAQAAPAAPEPPLDQVTGYPQGYEPLPPGGDFSNTISKGGKQFWVDSKGLEHEMAYVRGAWYLVSKT